MAAVRAYTDRMGFWVIVIVLALILGWRIPTLLRRRRGGLLPRITFCQRTVRLVPRHVRHSGLLGRVACVASSRASVRIGEAATAPGT